MRKGQMTHWTEYTLTLGNNTGSSQRYFFKNLYHVILLKSCAVALESLFNSRRIWLPTLIIIILASAKCSPA